MHRPQAITFTVAGRTISQHSYIAADNKWSSNLTHGRVAAARFYHIRQVAPMCTSSNTSQLGSTLYQFCPMVSGFEYINQWTGLVHACPRPGHSSFKITRSCTEIRTQSNTWFFGLTRALISNGILIGSAVVAGLTTVTGRLTDRPHYSVSNNRPHLCSTVLRPKNVSVINAIELGIE